ncbi:MAG TPA: radical SAM protein [Bacteroidota bacterium]|nr:radical SAM protein [Bacteroidota bacterium]
MEFIPSYIPLYASGEFQRRLNILEGKLESCTICPHDCGNNRLKDEIARCYSGYLPVVSAYCQHFGEEPALGGSEGVGNIFLGNCNLRCVYCQNFQISQNWKEEKKNEVSFERMAEMMLELQAKGVHAIGFVSPTHFVPQIVRALSIAIPQGLHLPLIYNTNAYDAVDVLRLLDGIFDIYLPDLKYSEDDFGYKYSKVRSYTEISRNALKEMHRQVGSDLVYGDDGLVKRGLIVRHLVLPNDIASSEETLRWISAELDSRVTLSVMSQYYPTHKALTTELLDRRIRESEYDKVMRLLDKYRFENGWAQEFESHDYYRPDFNDRVEPFKK